MKKAHVPNPTVTLREAVLALLRPLDVDAAERGLEALAGVPHVVVFASARGAIAAAVGELAPQGRVAMPGYTCIALANAVRSGGGAPVYVDVDGRGLVPPSDWPDDVDLVVTQDTYGFAATGPQTGAVVRDATHRADLVLNGNASLSVTSFEHSKWLSAGQGGMAVTRDAALAKALRERRDAAPERTDELRHGVFTLLSVMWGRAQFRGWSRPASWLRRAIARLDRERMGGQSTAELKGLGVEAILLGRPSRVSARLMTTQFAQLEAVAAHRRRIVAAYDRVAGIERPAEPLVRYPLAVADPHAFEAELARTADWNLDGRWFSAPLHPARAAGEEFGYHLGDAPRAEQLAATVVNLPTHTLVDEATAERLARLAVSAGAQPLT